MRYMTFEVDKEVQHITDWIKNYFVNNGPNSKAIIGISGGKDSTIAAALLVRALGPEKVFGVLMPETVQADIEDSRLICKHLGINFIEVDIAPACAFLYREIDRAYDDKCKIETVPAVRTNTPARIRMTTLYALAADIGGRVVNTCNRSEEYVGYSTKYGDAAGDFAIFQEYTVREILAIGDYLGLPENWVHKTPSDGMCGQTDEDNLGFSYETLDAYLLDKVTPDYEAFKNIKERYKRNAHKRNVLHLPCPRPLTRHWSDVEYNERELIEF